MRQPKQRETKDLLDRFRTFLKYDAETGDVTFTDNRKGAVEVGQLAGHVRKDGYLGVYHRDQNYMLHRVAWVLYYGKWPEHTIDHINRIKTDNRISNLRDVPQSINNTNKGKYNKLDKV